AEHRRSLSTRPHPGRLARAPGCEPRREALMARRSSLIRGLSCVAIVGTIALAVLAAGSVRLYWVWSREALPDVDGEARLPGLSAPVVVRRDAVGVPHIR